MNHEDFDIAKLKSYPLSELRDIEKHIDKEKYPDRYLALVNEIRNRPNEVAPAKGQSREKARKPLVAAFLGFFFGLGQLYNGQIKKAGFVYIITQILPAILLSTNFPANFYVLISLIPVGLLITVLVMRDAYISAKRVGTIRLNWYNRWYIYSAILLVQLLLIIPILEVAFPYSIKAYRIPAGSMEPAIEIGDHIVAHLRAYESSEPKRGDVIIFEYPKDPSKDFIKRIIGLPGEKVEMREKKVFINGEAIEDPWGVAKGGVVKEGIVAERDNFDPVFVPRGKYFVLGDNRDRSFDSRFLGFIERSKIRGKVLFIYWAKDKSRIATVLK